MACSTTSSRKVLISHSQIATYYQRATSWHFKLPSRSCSQDPAAPHMECIVQTVKGFTRLIFPFSSQWFAGSGKQTSKQITRSEISWSYKKSRYCLHRYYPGSIAVRIVLKGKLVTFLWGQAWVRNYNYLPYLLPWELKYFLQRMKKRALSTKTRHLFSKDMGNSTHYTSKTVSSLPLMFNNFYPKVPPLLRQTTDCPPATLWYASSVNTNLQSFCWGPCSWLFFHAILA